MTFRPYVQGAGETIEESFRIAWNYQEATGELDNHDTAVRHLLDTIDTLSKRHEALLLIGVDPITVFDSIMGCVTTISVEYAPLTV